MIFHLIRSKSGYKDSAGLGIFSHAQFFLGKAIDIDFAIKGNPIALGSKLRNNTNYTLKILMIQSMWPHSNRSCGPGHWG